MSLSFPKSAAGLLRRILGEVRSCILYYAAHLIDAYGLGDYDGDIVIAIWQPEVRCFRTRKVILLIQNDVQR